MSFDSASVTGCNRNTDLHPSGYPAVFLQFVDDRLCFINRDGKSDPFIVHIADFGGINPNDLAKTVDEGATGISRIDGRIGLDIGDGITSAVRAFTTRLSPEIMPSVVLPPNSMPPG